MAAVQWASRGQKLHTAIPSGQDKDRIALRVTSEAEYGGFRVRGSCCGLRSTRRKWSLWLCGQIWGELQ